MVLRAVFWAVFCTVVLVACVSDGHSNGPVADIVDVVGDENTVSGFSDTASDKHDVTTDSVIVGADVPESDTNPTEPADSIVNPSDGVFDVDRGELPVDEDITQPADLLDMDDSAFKCEELPKMDPLPLSEASGAEFVVWGGKSWLLVVADSGHGGQFVAYQPDSQQTISGVLPMDETASDDLEGLTTDSVGTVFGLTSSGYVREWTFSDSEPGQALLHTRSYPLGDFGGGDVPCSPFGINCGKNFEGLCLSTTPLSNGCSGYAVSKATGSLYCVTGGNGTPLSVNSNVDPLFIAPADQLSGCAFAPADPDTVYVSLNVYGSADVLRVTITAEDSIITQPLSVFAGINPEAIAIDSTSVLWVINDTQTLTSDAPISRYRCVGTP